MCLVILTIFCGGTWRLATNFFAASSPPNQPCCGNAFAGLGFEDAEEMAAKADLVREIRRTMERRGLTQVHVAKLTGVRNQLRVKVRRLEVCRHVRP